MRVSSTPLAALVLGLPALCAALVLPPGLQLTDTQLAALEAIPQSANPDGISFSLGCAACNWHRDAKDEVGVPYQSGLESNLLFDIKITRDRRTLNIGGADIFPLGPPANFHALQVPSTVPSNDYSTLAHSFRDLKLNYILHPTKSLVLDTITREVTIQLAINAVGGVPNQAIDRLYVVLHQDTQTQQLQLVNVSKEPQEEVAVMIELYKLTSQEEYANCRGFNCVAAMLRYQMDKLCGNRVAPSEMMDCDEDWQGHQHMGDWQGHRSHHNGDHMEETHREDVNHMGDTQHMKGGHMGGSDRGRYGGAHMEETHNKEDVQHMKGNHMRDSSIGYHNEDHMEEESQHMKDNQYMNGDHMNGNHMRDSNSGRHHGGGRMEETHHSEDVQHMKGNHMGDSDRGRHGGGRMEETQHMNNNQHMKDNQHMDDSQHMNDNQHMGDSQGHRSHHNGDHMWKTHMEDSQYTNKHHMNQGHCRHRGGSHRSQWRKYSRPAHTRLFTRLIRQVLVPTLVGILAGVAVSLVGLIVGKGMRKLCKSAAKRRGAIVMHEDEDEDEDVADEEKGLLEEMEVREEQTEEVVEGPPAYIDGETKVVEKE